MSGRAVNSPGWVNIMVKKHVVSVDTTNGTTTVSPVHSPVASVSERLTNLSAADVARWDWIPKLLAAESTKPRCALLLFCQCS